MRLRDFQTCRSVLTVYIKVSYVITIFYRSRLNEINIVLFPVLLFNHCSTSECGPCTLIPSILFTYLYFIKFLNHYYIIKCIQQILDLFYIIWYYFILLNNDSYHMILFEIFLKKALFHLIQFFTNLHYFIFYSNRKNKF